MKLQLSIDGNEDEIEILSPLPSCQFRFGGKEHSAEVQVAEPGVYSVLSGGRSYDASVERTPQALVVTIDGHRFEVEVRDPRRWKGSVAQSGGAGRQTLTAPMPGKVVRVLVATGDAVEAGQGILVVEAMKMQNQLKAARAGTVVAIHTREGATVTAGEPLAAIE
jgi:biotin carboxyl carrier protein